MTPTSTGPPPKLPQITLFFGPEFPGFENTCHVLKANLKNGRVTSWAIGKAKHCDFPVNSLTISRKHCTIYFDRVKGTWFILDGGEYPDTPQSPASYSPSANGTWLSRSGYGRDNFKRLEPANEEPIEPGSRIMLGPDLRFRVVTSYDEYPSLPKDPWPPELWPHIVPKGQPKSLEPAVKRELHAQASANAPWQTQLGLGLFDRIAGLSTGKLMILIVGLLAGLAIVLIIRQ